MTALIAAYYWHKSSIVSAQAFGEPDASYDDGLSVQVIMAELNIGNIRLAMNEACRLNMWAARWTGVSAVLSPARHSPGCFTEHKRPV